MTIAVPGKWLWDSWYAHDGDRWHGFFLQADSSLGDPDLRHFNVSQGHATSTDLVDLDHLGTIFGPSARSGLGRLHDLDRLGGRGRRRPLAPLLHRHAPVRGRLYQRIGHATSTDLHNWTRVGDGLCLDLDGPSGRVITRRSTRSATGTTAPCATPG